jgi:hypothetical protein
MVEQGQKIYSAIFKRVWRSMKEEFKKLYILNGIYLPETGQSYPGGKAQKADYLPSPTDIVPAADPKVVSEMQRIQIAAAVADRASKTPGYDPEAVEKNLLRAWRVEGATSLYPGIAKFPPQGEDPKVTIQKMKQQDHQLKVKQDNIQFALTLMEDQRVNNAKILELRANALKLSEDARSEQAWATVAAVEASVKALEAHNNTIMKHIEMVMKGVELDGDPESTHGGGMASLALAAGDRLATPGGPAPQAESTGAME